MMMLLSLGRALGRVSAAAMRSRGRALHHQWQAPALTCVDAARCISSSPSQQTYTSTTPAAAPTSQRLLSVHPQLVSSHSDDEDDYELGTSSDHSQVEDALPPFLQQASTLSFLDEGDARPFRGNSSQAFSPQQTSPKPLQRYDPILLSPQATSSATMALENPARTVTNLANAENSIRPVDIFASLSIHLHSALAGAPEVYKERIFNLDVDTLLQVVRFYSGADFGGVASVLSGFLAAHSEVFWSFDPVVASRNLAFAREHNLKLRTLACDSPHQFGGRVPLEDLYQWLRSFNLSSETAIAVIAPSDAMNARTLLRYSNLSLVYQRIAVLQRCYGTHLADKIIHANPLVIYKAPAHLLARTVVLAKAGVVQEIIRSQDQRIVTGAALSLTALDFEALVGLKKTDMQAINKACTPYVNVNQLDSFPPLKDVIAAVVPEAFRFKEVRLSAPKATPQPVSDPC